MRDFAGKAAYSNPSYSSAGGVVAATLQDSMQTVGLVVQGNSSWVASARVSGGCGGGFGGDVLEPVQGSATA
jgi:hypothetical protein